MSHLTSLVAFAKGGDFLDEGWHRQHGSFLYRGNRLVPSTLLSLVPLNDALLLSYVSNQALAVHFRRSESFAELADPLVYFLRSLPIRSVSTAGSCVSRETVYHAGNRLYIRGVISSDDAKAWGSVVRAVDAATRVMGNQARLLDRASSTLPH